ncbi:MAG: D-alanine--D-alanine ligase [candidate division WOR-3 bacterium]
MKKKIKVAIIFGGRSAEHEISIISAKNIIDAIDKNKYEPIPIGIDKDGTWYLQEDFDLESNNPKFIKLNKSKEKVILVPLNNSNELISITTKKSKGKIDVAFPVLHGPYGEDGSIQGLFRMVNVPYVGAGVLGSAIGMDKDVLKRLLRDAKIPIPNFKTFTKLTIKNITFKEIAKIVGVPMFIKPAKLGSSVGISKVRDEKEFKKALDIAFQYDNKILIEEFIKGREIECSILGNDNPIASIPGEVIVKSDFYSYETKYLDEDGAYLEIPAKLPKRISKRIQEYAIEVFNVLSCEGMARVDFFLRNNTEILVNEINTIPGFTKISMYPKLWEASGISYPELIDRLIQLALERFHRERKLKISFK